MLHRWRTIAGSKDWCRCTIGAGPGRRLIGVQFTQQLWTSPSAPPVQRDFWTAVYQAIAD
jgi:hypothetical protein